MTNQNQNETNNHNQGEKTMEESKEKCQLCGGVGTNGARWLVKTKEGKTIRVHKPCGEKLVAAAPKEKEARLVPSPELKAQWTAERTERQARDFWANQCPQLLEIKKGLEQEEKAMT